VVTAIDGSVVWSADWEPFGTVAIGSGQLTSHLRFPGQYFDEETGLHYNYYRHYDPTTGRYIESDPIGLIAGLNTFAYVDGDPVLTTDPFGLFDITGTKADAAKDIITLCIENPNTCKEAPKLGGRALIGLLGSEIVVGAAVVGSLGYLAYNAITPDSAQKGCYEDNKDECDEIRKKIANAIAQLRNRYNDLLIDRYDLFNNAFIEPNLGKRKGTYMGHQEQFEAMQTFLRKLIKKAKELGCDIDNNAELYALLQVPLSPLLSN